MNIELVNPSNGIPLRLSGSSYVDDRGVSFPIVHGVVRFVSPDNYAKSFGYQWNTFQKTQLDAPELEEDLSRARLFATTEWAAAELASKKILEAGSGAGRFTRVILSETEADLYSLDYSDAVTANFRNNAPHARLTLCQASIYEMPFLDGVFDKVICLGVLQHTPDFEGAIKSLASKVRPGGELVVDFYAISGWWTKFSAKYILRPITKKMGHQKLLSIISWNIDWLIGAYRLLSKLHLRALTRFLPICDIDAVVPGGISATKLREWAILDTFDMFSPEHDHPQRVATVAAWFIKYGLHVTFAGKVKYGRQVANVVRGTKI